MDLVYGLHPVRLALLAQRRVFHKLFLKTNASSTSLLEELSSIAEQLKLPVKTVSSNALKSMTNGAVHQGACLRASPLKYNAWSENTFQDMTSNVPNKLWVVLNGIHDPMNYGAILRSCYFFGVANIFSVTSESCGLTSVVSKASAGIMEIVPLTEVTNLQTFLMSCRCHGLNIIGTVGCSHSRQNKVAVDVASYELDKHTALIVGNEGIGIRSEILDFCDELITLPPGRSIVSGVDSLNVSVATGVILHTLLCKK